MLLQIDAKSSGCFVMGPGHFCPGAGINAWPSDSSTACRDECGNEHNLSQFKYVNTCCQYSASQSLCMLAQDLPEWPNAPDFTVSAAKCYASPPPADAVSGIGDPHLSNVRGERFDVYQPGSMSLLQLPRHAEPARTLLSVEADARRMNGECSVYFQTVSISGTWTNQSTPIQFLANPHGTPSGSRNWKDWMHFGAIELKVVLRKKSVYYLNVYARNVSHSGYEVGGLLGLDDHTAVSRRPQECSSGRIAVLTSSTAEGH